MSKGEWFIQLVKIVLGIYFVWITWMMFQKLDRNEFLSETAGSTTIWIK